MSDDESPVTHVIDSERLILEVEKRPALFNNKLKEYSDRNLKEKLWGEVCVNVLPNWNELSGTEKLQKGKEIQKKWKNLKDCFARELAAQRKLKSGEGATKRRKYIYFELLLFLLPYQQQRTTTSNIAPLPGEHGDEPASETSSLPSSSNEEHNNEPRSTPIRRHTKSVNTPKSSVSSYELSLLNILKAKQQEEVNEEKHFALMLVPMLAQLNDDQKHYAKVEILNILRNAKYYTPPPVFQEANVHLRNMAQPTYFTQRNQSHSLQISSPNTQDVRGSASDSESQQRTHFSQTPQLYHSQGSGSAQTYYSQFSDELLSPTGTSSTNDSDLYDLSNH